MIRQIAARYSTHVAEDDFLGWPDAGRIDLAASGTSLIGTSVWSGTFDSTTLTIRIGISWMFVGGGNGISVASLV